jgi:hypothetical protein
MQKVVLNFLVVVNNRMPAKFIKFSSQESCLSVASVIPIEDYDFDELHSKRKFHTRGKIFDLLRVETANWNDREMASVGDRVDSQFSSEAGEKDEIFSLNEYYSLSFR